MEGKPFSTAPQLRDESESEREREKKVWRGVVTSDELYKPSMALRVASGWQFPLEELILVACCRKSSLHRILSGEKEAVTSAKLSKNEFYNQPYELICAFHFLWSCSVLIKVFLYWWMNLESKLIREIIQLLTWPGVMDNNNNMLYCNFTSLITLWSEITKIIYSSVAI